MLASSETLSLHAFQPLVISTVVSGSIRSTVLTLEADSLVGEEVADARVAGGGDGETNDNTCVHVSPSLSSNTSPDSTRTERPQLGGNVLESSQALGNSVSYIVVKDTVSLVSRVGTEPRLPESWMAYRIVPRST